MKNKKKDVYENDKCKLYIIPEFCKGKGCEICIEFCPKKVLSLDPKRLISTASNMKECIACSMCEIRCPDFAIYIKKKKK